MTGAFHRSGLTRRQFALERGVAYTTLCGWLNRERGASAEAEVVEGKAADGGGGGAAQGGKGKRCARAGAVAPAGFVEVAGLDLGRAGMVAEVRIGDGAVARFYAGCGGALARAVVRGLRERC